MTPRATFVRPTRHLVALLVAIVALLGVLGPGPALAKRPNRKAARHFRLGKKHFRRGRYEKAEQSFAAAHEIDPDPLFLFNIGKCLEKQARYLGAIESYQAFLKAKPKAPNRKDVEVTIRYLEEKLAVTHAHLEVRTEPSGALVFCAEATAPAGKTPYDGWHKRELLQIRLALADHVPVIKEVDLMEGGRVMLEVKLVTADTPGKILLTDADAPAAVFVDDKALGHTPDKTEIVVPPGSHSLRLVREGYPPFVASVQVGPGAEATVAVVWAAPLPARPPTDSGDGDGDTKSFAPWPALGLAGLAVVAAGGGYGLHRAAGSSAEEARELSDTRGADRSEWQSKVDETDQRSMLSWISFGGAGAAAIGAVTLAVLHHMDDAPPAREADADAPEPEASLLLLPTPGGAAFVMRF